MEQDDQEITEEQRERAEANRLAALAKRKAAAEARLSTNQGAWRLFKCRKNSQRKSLTLQETKFPNTSIQPFSCPETTTHLPEKFRVRLEICSPDSFSVTPEPVKGIPYPGEAACLEKLADFLADVAPSHYTQNTGGGKACVHKLRDYHSVIRCLKNSRGTECEEIPWGTYNVVERFSDSYTSGRWIPCRPEHLPDEKVDELIGKLPKRLLDALLPFQLEGVKFGVRRGGRCLIADEMGLGKTLQAIAIAGCFMSEGSILVVCPAILRYSWAEELERWFPFCLPTDVHLVFGHQSNPANLSRSPKIVVISYTMLHRLRKSMLEQEWAVLIVDESHHLRCSKKSSEPQEIQAVLDMGMKLKRMVLLSGTPSLSRPGLLGKTKYEFAKTYCSVKFVRGFEGKVFQDFSKGIRLEELNVLLKQSVMIRRLKAHVLSQLPPKRRQIISLVLTRSDIVSAVEAVSRVESSNSSFVNNAAEEASSKSSGESNDDGGKYKSIEKLSYQEIGVAKLSGFREWLFLHPIFAELDCVEDMETSSCSHKMIIFAHHHLVIDRVQEFICEKGIGYIRIDGRTPATDRQLAIRSFQSFKEVKIAIIGIEAGGVGINLTSANTVVFLELPMKPSNIQQAEDRAHRQGQKKPVNIYFFCAKDTTDEGRWRTLNKSFHRVSTVMNGKYDAIHEIEVEDVSHLESTGTASGRNDNALVLENETCSDAGEVKLAKFPSCCINLDLEPIEVYDGISEKENQKRNELTRNNGIFSQEDNPCSKVDVIDKLILKECNASNKVLEGNVFEAKIESAEGDFSHNTVGSCEGNGQMEVNICPGIAETTNVEGVVQLDGAGENSSIQLNSLRFEVSEYTGRIHLYECISGVDLRPRPLFESFRPEEVEIQDLPEEDSNRKESELVKDDLKYRHALLVFINEWKKLRRIEPRKLLGKPVQLPLSTEFCYLRGSLNHDVGGLLKGKSKRRMTPLDEISHPLPTNAVWKKIRLCSGLRRKEKEYAQGWSLMDEPLCKLCQNPCKNSNAKAPEYFEDLFCDLRCYEEYRFRTSNRFLREGLFQIEHGICTHCQLNCHKLVEDIRPLSHDRRKEHVKKVAPKLAENEKLLDRLVREPVEGNAWHADHIIPVYQGGGECQLENMRTLCVACHADVTKAQHAERRSTNVNAKKLLKAAISTLRNVQSTEETNAKPKEHGQSKIEEQCIDDDLFVSVPGSAYSRPKTY